MAISNTTIQIRKSGITGNVPPLLNFGELAINYYDGKLYYKNSSGNISYFYGANNGPSFATANANSSLILATLPNDTLSFSSSNGVSITSNTSTKTISLGLSTTGVTAGTYGSSSNTPIIVVDSFGRITSVSNVATSGGTSSTLSTTNLDVFTANGSGQTFVLSVTPININSTVVNINGATQQKSSYTLSGSTITLSEVVPNGTIVEVSTLIGTTPSAAAAIISNVDTFTANGVANTFALSQTPYGTNSTFVNIDGVLQQRSTYTLSGSSILFSAAPPNNSKIEITSFINAANSSSPSTALISQLDAFVGNGSTTVYTLSVTPSGKNFATVNVDGVTQQKATYSLFGNTLTFTTPPPNGSNIEVVSLYSNTAVFIGYAQGSVTANSLIYYNGNNYGSFVNSNVYSNGAISFTSNVYTTNIISSGTITGTLASTGVTAGTYGGATQLAVITVNAGGQITSAANVSPSIANTQITGTITSSQLSATGVTTGTYGGATNIPVLVVNAAGQVTSAANVAVTSGTTITNEITSANTYYPILTTSNTGSISAANTSSTKLTYVPSTGTLSATVMSSTSDKNLKENITIIDNALDIINGIDGVRFDWKETKIPSAGLIAQQVGMFMPELVSVDEDGNKSLNYNGVIGVLVQAIKEQQKQIDALMKKVK